MSPTKDELEAFTEEFSNWLSANKPDPNPGFLLPQTFMEVGTEQQFDYLLDWQKKVYNAGYLGMSWPEEYGGRGMPQIFQDIVTKEMVRQKTPFMVNTIGLNWAGPLILNLGTHEQKQKYIPGILSGEDIWCQGFSEPDNGSDLGNAQLKAVKDGNEYVLNGSKIWTTLGQQAKYMILLARTSTEGKSKYDGLSYFLSPMNVEGVDVQPIRKLTGEYGFNQTFFTDARIPATCIFGEEGEGWKMAVTTLQFERGAAGGQAGGPMAVNPEAADVVALAREVKRGGRPAIEDAFIRDELVKFLLEEKTMRLNAARMRHGKLVEERPFSIPMSGKLLSTEWQRRLCEFAVNLQGTNAGYYVGDDNAYAGGLWQRAYFNAFSATIGGGTTQIQHNIVGERVLGLAKD